MDNVKKLIDGVLATYGWTNGTRLYCPFCEMSKLSAPTLADLHHANDCIYLLAKKMKEEMDDVV